jgi:tetratricopeptide (TPR) repeat protein/cold shock CspA family protein
MEIPSVVSNAVRDGKVVLFLGAGASFGSSTSNGEKPLSGYGLRDALSQHFLNGKQKDDSLTWVAELSISVTDLGTVQDFIAEKFRNLEPANFHLLLSTFKWRGLVTTNYDRLIERIYEKSDDPIQKLVPFISNSDRVDDKLRDQNHLALLKLHGCITRTHDAKLPLILTIDQYNSHREGRDRLFKIFYEWCHENTVIFIGYSLQDADLRSILLEVSREIEYRPRYYLVKPNIDPLERELWAEKKITVLDGSFEDFLKSLNSSIYISQRSLAKIISNVTHPIQRKFLVSEPLGGVVKDLLEHDVQYIYPEIESKQGTPKLFYRGFDLEWYPIVNDLDVRRRLTDTVLFDIIIRPEEDRPTKAELYLIKAEAGAGKSIFLRRVAWEAATQTEALCLFSRPFGIPGFNAIHELYKLTKERIFLFIDAAADNVSTIFNLIEGARKQEVPLTIITAERINEWNMSCNDIAGYVSDEYRLQYLSQPEIINLIKLLKEHNELGPNLKEKSPEEQIKEFEEKAGRQLLVALHEATMGRPFEEILIDEYMNIHPLKAQSLYLTVCFLNRLNIPVRAGLISRVHGIAFTEFKEKLFSPLEHVVQVLNKKSIDFMYTARHPEIAQIVFEGVLTESNDRYNEYVRVFKHLNISYDTDRESFRKLIKAKTLETLFQNHEEVQSIFDAALEIAQEEAYLYQQMANYERLRVGGDLQKAYEYLRKARELEPRDNSIIHSLAELARTKALNSSRALERRQFRNEARSLLENLLNVYNSDLYARHTYIKLAIDDLKDILEHEDSSDRDIDEAIRKAEQAIETTRQKYPTDFLVETSEAELGKLLDDNQRSLDALQNAFRLNPRDPYIAIRLARIYQNKNDLISAKEYLSKALENNRSSKELNFHYAHIQRLINPSDSENIAYYFRRAFTKWDHNYDAQFWYARYLFESTKSEEIKESKEIFKRLRNIPIEHESRVKIKDVMHNDSFEKRSFEGTISRIEITHGFVVIDGRGDDIFFHRKNISSEAWDQIKNTSRVVFNLGFTFGGPVAVEVNLI